MAVQRRITPTIKIQILHRFVKNIPIFTFQKTLSFQMHGETTGVKMNMQIESDTSGHIFLLL